MCKIAIFLQDVTVAMSLLSLLMTVIERYQAITSPLVADPTSGRRCKIMILSTWLVACLMYATHFYTFKLIIEDEGAICVHIWELFLAEPSKVWEIEFLLHSILFVFIPFIESLCSPFTQQSLSELNAHLFQAMRARELGEDAGTDKNVTGTCSACCLQ